MQTLLATLIVLSAVAYVIWQWMPTGWRKVLVPLRHSAAREAHVPVQSRAVSTTCTACSTCGACAGKGR